MTYGEFKALLESEGIKDEYELHIGIHNKDNPHYYHPSGKKYEVDLCIGGNKPNWHAVVSIFPK